MTSLKLSERFEDWNDVRARILRKAQIYRMCAVPEDHHLNQEEIQSHIGFRSSLLNYNEAVKMFQESSHLVRILSILDILGLGDEKIGWDSDEDEWRFGYDKDT